MNLGKKSASVSLGGKGAHVTAGTSGKVSASAGLPGTGLSYTTSTGGTGSDGSAAKPSELTAIIAAAIFAGIVAVIIWALWPKAKTAPNPVTQPSISAARPAGSFTGQGTAAPDKVNLEQAARDYLAQDHQLEVASVQMLGGSIIEVTLSVPGVTDQAAPEEAPDGWEELVRQAVSAQVRLPEEIGSSLPAIIIVRDADGTLLLSVQRGKISYDAYQETPEDAEDKPSSGPTSGTIYVWVSTGGSRYHTSSTCSGMTDPSMITLDEALRRGYTACKTCH